jgi:DNA polymerase III subunit epsilon
MKLQLTRPLAIFDLEATGLNISKERIVEIAILKINPDGSEERFKSLVNPEMVITEEVIKIHGISNEDVKDSPTFKELAEKVVQFIGESDLAGYNSNKFDIPLLAEELIRVGCDFDLSSRHFVDVQNIFHKMEQRTLSAAYQFYCQKELIDAHDAMNDTNATWEVLKSQLEKYDSLKTDISSLAEFSRAGNLKTLDFAGRLVINENGFGVYNFGKHKGKTIKEVHEMEPGYYSWFISPTTDFPLYTKQKLREEMEKIKNEHKIEKESSFDLNSQLEALKSKFQK